MSESTPRADYDSAWKTALAQYLREALELFLPAVATHIDWTRGYELLDKELEQVIREAELNRRIVDLLVRVWRHNGEDTWLLMHLEVQAQYDATLAERMFVYHYRLFDRYHRPLLSIALLADSDATWRPAAYQHEVLGCRVEMHYPIVKVHDWAARAKELAASTNPFAVVVQAHLAAQATQGSAEQRAQTKIGLIRGLYQRGFERAQVLELLRLIDWLLALPEAQSRYVIEYLTKLEEEEKVQYVTSWERIGEERGEERGIAIGRIEGELQGLSVALDIKFGERGLALLPELRQIVDPALLRRIGEGIKAASTIEELRRLYTSDEGA